jgi:hypothetical protein
LATFTRSTLRAGLRDKLFAWPDFATTVAEDVDASETAIDLTAVTNLAEQSIIEIESELMQVISISTLTATVVRGYRGTTAATHANGTAVKFYPKWGWSDATLDQKISEAILWLREGPCWTLVFKTNTWLAEYKEFGMPTGVIYPSGDIVKAVEMKNGSGGSAAGDEYSLILGWRHVGDRIFINQNLDINRAIRLWIQQHQPLLTNDSAVLDDDKYLEPVILYATSRCLEELLANRARFYEYSASLNDRASSPDELQRLGHYFYNQATVLRDQISRPGLSGFAPIHRMHL